MEFCYILGIFCYSIRVVYIYLTAQHECFLHWTGRGYSFIISSSSSLVFLEPGVQHRFMTKSSGNNRFVCPRLVVKPETMSSISGCTEYLESCWKRHRNTNSNSAYLLLRVSVLVWSFRQWFLKKFCTQSDIFTRASGDAL